MAAAFLLMPMPRDIAIPGTADSRRRLPAILNRLMDRMGGETGYADIVFDGFCESRGVNPETGKRDESLTRAPHREVFYHSLIRDLTVANDKTHIDDKANDVQPEELRAEAMEFALLEMERSEPFRKAVLEIFVRRNPEVLAGMLENMAAIDTESRRIA